MTSKKLWTTGTGKQLPSPHSLEQYLNCKKEKLCDGPPLPYQYSCKFVNGADCDVLWHSNGVKVHPNAVRLGSSITNAYRFLYCFCGEADFRRLIAAYPNEALQCVVHLYGMPSGVVLMAKAPEEYSSLQEIHQETTVRDSYVKRPVDFCVSFRVPREWCHELPPPPKLRKARRVMVTPQMEDVPHNLSDPGELLRLAARGDARTIRRMVVANADPNARDRTGWRPLIVAASEGHAAVCQVLVESRADVNAENSFGGMALSLAAKSGHGDVCGVLLPVQGIEVNDSDRWGETALMMAAKSGHIHVVRMLLEAQADPHLSNLYGMDARAMAKERGFLDVCRVLELETSRLDTERSERKAKLKSTRTTSRVTRD